MATEIDIKELLTSGAHFGHKTSRWHPKMAPFIHSKRDGIHIIDLSKTVLALETAGQFISEISKAGKQILFVSTKRQAKEIVQDTAVSLNQPYVCERWLGGMLTNWQTIESRVKHLKDLEERMASGELASKYNKLEVQRYQEEINNLRFLYGGLVNLTSMPAAIFVVDIIKEANAIKEANKLNIPTIAIVDTNCDPSLITYPIPANDDAIKTIQLICDYTAKAFQEGVSKQPTKEDKTK